MKLASLIAVAFLASSCDSSRSAAGPGHDGNKDGLRPASLEQEVERSIHTHGIENGEAKREVGSERSATPDDGDVGVHERPSVDTTGPSNPATLLASESISIATNGAVVENLDVTGMITIDADSVTLRNFRINAAGFYYGIKVVGGHRGVVLEDGEVTNARSAAILGAGFAARRLHIHDCEGDGFKTGGEGGPVLVEHCFIERLGTKEDAHADGNQTRGGSNITFRYNNIYMPKEGTPGYPGAPYKSNAAFMISGDVSDFVIEGNWLTGGNYTIYCRNPAGSGVFVRNNRFGRENGGWSAGKEARRLRSGTCSEWIGNRWDVSGDPI